MLEKKLRLKIGEIKSELSELRHRPLKKFETFYLNDEEIDVLDRIDELEEKLAEYEDDMDEYEDANETIKRLERKYENSNE